VELNLFESEKKLFEAEKYSLILKGIKDKGNKCL
jgi:hypothetical protein